MGMVQKLQKGNIQIHIFMLDELRLANRILPASKPRCLPGIPFDPW